MTEHPILFSAPMIRALLTCTKSQTRRIAKFEPLECGLNMSFSGLDPAEIVPGVWTLMSRGAGGAWNDRTEPLRCPYGQPGDRLWVRETFYAYGRWETRYSEKKKRDEWHFIDLTRECDRLYQFDASNMTPADKRGSTPGWHKRPSIHMPRTASRMTLQITGVRVERLQSISAADCWAEGIEECDGMLNEADICRLAKEMRRSFEDPQPTYAALWESIHGPGSWSINPWVWRVEFCSSQIQAAPEKY